MWATKVSKWLITPTNLCRRNSIVNAYLWVSLGGVLGATIRYALSRYAAKILSPNFPYGTLLINVTGSLLLGWFMIWTTERTLADPRWRLFLAIGFCGSYTTFSSYAFESFSYLEQGHYALFASNVIGNNVLCLLAVLAGAAIARAM
jgi:CrcB protein